MFGVLERIRTSDPSLRRRVLYPAELRRHKIIAPVNFSRKGAKSQHQLAFFCFFGIIKRYSEVKAGEGTELLKRIRKTFLSKGFIEFCALGIINTFNDSLFSWFFSLLVGEGNTAAIMGYALALTVAYLLSSRFIFYSKPELRKYIRFVISYIPNFIIFVLVNTITVKTWGLPQFWGTAIAAAAGGPITYVIIKIYAFGKK